MKNIHYTAFWLGLFIFLSIWVIVVSKNAGKTDDLCNGSPAEIMCAKNNGIPQYKNDFYHAMIGCKIYKK